MKRLELIQCNVTGLDTFDLLFGNGEYLVGLGIDPTRQPRTFNLTISKNRELIVGLSDATLIECITELSKVTLDIDEDKFTSFVTSTAATKEIAKTNYEEGL